MHCQPSSDFASFFYLYMGGAKGGLTVYMGGAKVGLSVYVDSAFSHG